MKIRSLIVCLILGGILAGCGTGYNNGLVAREWGTSYNLAIANQTANPDAEKNLSPVTGVDNQVADRIITKYNKEFEKPAQAPVFSLSMPGNLGNATRSNY